MRAATDVCVQDICKPEPLRLRRNLSAIINFAKFREEKLVPYTEMQEQTISLLEETDQLEESNRELVGLFFKYPQYLSTDHLVLPRVVKRKY